MSETVANRIVYMEDDAGLARLLKKHLERHGYLVDIAGNGEEGLSLLRENFYCVALVDYNMPVLSGMEVMLRLKELELAPPVIMLTGEGNERVAVDAMKLGAADYLVKDVEMGYLELLPIVIEQVRQREQLVQERETILIEARESEERYRKLVELSPDGIAVQCDGRFEFINPAGAEMLGVRSCEELVGRDVLEFVHPDYHDVFLERLRLLEESDVELPWMEEKLLQCDGTEVDVEITAMRFTYDGKPAFQAVFRDITERKAAERRLERMAKYDALTGLPNRSFFFDRLNQLMLQAQRDNSMFALLFIDLDRFKEANDRLGHYFGDLLLKEVARRLIGCVRQSDTVARMGGDEFVVIVSKIDAKEDAAAMAQRIGESIAEPLEVQGERCQLGASIGISLYPEDGDTQELQLVKADTAMYRSKRQGRNNYQFYS
jgi:diguanylate cyclase (GGDEF)-like protein/PAS domain S-box-containing protein